jgi:hypothetical protein
MKRICGAAFALVATLSALACRRSPMAKIEALRDGLAASNRDAALAAIEIAPCPAPRTDASVATCLDAAARAFGAPGFSAAHPDQASAAAVAYVLVRHHDGAFIPKPEAWLEALARAPGPGADSLRLAVAEAMADASPQVGKHVDDEAAARALLGAVAKVFPGACVTYAKLGAGADLASLVPDESPDHSACVQRDLTRKDGPGAAYGDGLWRAAAGAAALWKDGSRALTIGFGTTEGAVRRAIERRLGAIDAATHDLAVRTVATTQTAGYGASGAAGHPDRLAPGSGGADAGAAPRPASRQP